MHRLRRLRSVPLDAEPEEEDIDLLLGFSAMLEAPGPAMAIPVDGGGLGPSGPHDPDGLVDPADLEDLEEVEEPEEADEAEEAGDDLDEVGELEEDEAVDEAVEEEAGDAVAGDAEAGEDAGGKPRKPAGADDAVGVLPEPPDADEDSAD
jgi:hypothetical protein